MKNILNQKIGISFIQILIFMLLLAACGEGQLFEDPAVKATRVSSERYAGQTMQYIQTQVPTIIALNATLDAIPAMGTQYAQLDQQNRSLQATLRAMNNQAPITSSQSVQLPQSTQPIAALPPAQSDIFNSNYQNVAVSSGVKEADGCATDARTSFTITGQNDPIRLYLTALAVSIEEGMIFSSRWMNSAGTQFITAGWTADGDYESLCIYFWITSADIDYTSGDWTAELLVNDQPVGQTNFRLCLTGESC